MRALSVKVIALCVCVVGLHVSNTVGCLALLYVVIGAGVLRHLGLVVGVTCSMHRGN
jgi:hypothetical protein